MFSAHEQIRRLVLTLHRVLFLQSHQAMEHVRGRDFLLQRVHRSPVLVLSTQRLLELVAVQDRHISGIHLAIALQDPSDLHVKGVTRINVDTQDCRLKIFRLEIRSRQDIFQLSLGVVGPVKPKEAVQQVSVEHCLPEFPVAVQRQTHILRHPQHRTRMHNSRASGSIVVERSIFFSILASIGSRSHRSALRGDAERLRLELCQPAFQIVHQKVVQVLGDQAEFEIANSGNSCPP
mmetsp:Transcript_11264/g.26942  ORF Transcript_11264/g.26942 Transcript_11264/m.26942 type:complete len:235 (-) Transcript_11264:786-1490(-)